MSTGERQRKIIQILTMRRFETMRNLAYEVGASERTIRRDIAILTNDYPLETVHGKYCGVKLADKYNPHKGVLSCEYQQALIIAAKTTDVNTARLLGEILSLLG